MREPIDFEDDCLILGFEVGFVLRKILEEKTLEILFAESILVYHLIIQHA